MSSLATQALEMNGLELKVNKEDGIRTSRMSQIISLLPNKVDPKKAQGVTGTLVLYFVDTEVGNNNNGVTV